MRIAVLGCFDDIRSRHVRVLREAARLGEVVAILWSDAAAESLEGRRPRFPQEERLYILRSIRYVREAVLAEAPAPAGTLPLLDRVRPDAWAVPAAEDDGAKRAFCAGRGIGYRVLGDDLLRGIPAEEPGPPIGGPAPVEPGRRAARRVIVTGCYDWFHSGHIRFFEEVAELGDLHVVVGHDANIRLLKGEGHPLFPQEERRFMVGSVRFVRQALVSTGTGWLDAEPEIGRLRPDIYAVNEDGDRPEKREFCERSGIRYVVLRRTPKEGLPRRQSTELRGF